MRILAYRFSAFGDVAMAAIVCREFLEQNPEHELVFVSRQNFSALFQGIPGLTFVGIDIEKYRGFAGLYRLADELTHQYKPDYIADLHDVIRTKFLNLVFKGRGFAVSQIDKGKKEKEHLTDVWNLDKEPLKSTHERYADVFRRLGFHITLSHRLSGTVQHRNGIGFAPFAQHSGKMLPLEVSFEIAKELSKVDHVYFFGSRGSEAEILQNWEQKIPHSSSLAGKLQLENELTVIQNLMLMVSMDSANMHLASLVGTRCVSIWGATHPYAGFLGFGQSLADTVQIKDLTCRPCSVFGDKECYRGDYACLHEISATMVLQKVVAAYSSVAGGVLESDFVTAGR